MPHARFAFGTGQALCILLFYFSVQKRDVNGIKKSTVSPNSIGLRLALKSDLFGLRIDFI